MILENVFLDLPPHLKVMIKMLAPLKHPLFCGCRQGTPEDAVVFEIGAQAYQGQLDQVRFPSHHLHCSATGYPLALELKGL